MHCIFIYNYASRCHGLRLSVLNKETTYLLTYVMITQEPRCKLGRYVN